MKLSRGLARHTAESAGWFWMPCVICGQEFGGFELATTDHRDSIPNDPYGGNTGTIICPDCADAGWGCYTRARLHDLAFHDCEHVQRAMRHLRGLA